MASNLLTIRAPRSCITVKYYSGLSRASKEAQLGVSMRRSSTPFPEPANRGRKLHTMSTAASYGALDLAQSVAMGIENRLLLA